MRNLTAGVALLAVSAMAEAAQPNRSSFWLGRTDKVDCVSRALPPVLPVFKEGGFRPLTDKEQAEYDAAWDKYMDDLDACWVFSTASNQWVLIESGKDYRARAKSEPAKGAGKAGLPIDMSQLKLFEYSPPPTPPVRPDPKPKVVAPNDVARDQKAAVKKAATSKVAFRMDKGHMLCDVREVNLPPDLFKKVVDEKLLAKGYQARPLRPVSVLGSPLEHVYVRFNEKQKKALFVSRVTGNAREVNARLQVLHAKAPAATVSQGVPGTRNPQRGVRYSYTLPKAEGMTRNLSVEQASGASSTDIVCAVAG